MKKFLPILILLHAHAFAGPYIFEESTSVPSARAYTQDGLVAMWDSRENIGWGIHSGDTMVWKDLVGSFDATQRKSTGWRWNDDAYVCTSNTGQGFTVPDSFTAWLEANKNGHTIEFVSSRSSTARMTVFGGYSGYNVNFEYYSSGAQFRVYYNSTPDFKVTSADGRVTYTVRSSSTAITVYRNGVFAGQTSSNNYSATTSSRNLVIGGEVSRPAMSMLGEICAIRVYNKVLSTDELIYNAMIDRIRYGTGYKNEN